jgi:probable F420-dependent oxidoreductase
MTTQHPDLSAYVVAGRVASRLPDDLPNETAVRTPRQGLADAVEAEQLGFRRIFFSERWNLKEAGVFLGAVGARTEHLGLATGLVSPARRHLLHMAAFGATMQAMFGERFVLGLGRGDHGYLKHEGLRTAGYDGIVDHVQLLHRLWAGEVVTHDGPAGRYESIKLGDVHQGAPPEVWSGSFALPRAAAAAATAFDGVILPPLFTPDAVAAAVARLREACERIDRDPASLRVVACVITAPDLAEDEARALAHARAVTYLQAKEYGDATVRANGWDPEPVQRLRAHQQLTSGEMADTAFHRIELLEPARLVPDSWIEESCALGSSADVVARLRDYRAAGADEVATYGSTPGQNAAVAAAWRTPVPVGAP